MEDKVIEIARFEQSTEAEMLANLLKSEGIECYVRDGISSRVMFGKADTGGAKVDILQKDARQALEIMKYYNYDIPEYLREMIASEDSEPYDTDGYDSIAEGETEEYDTRRAENKARLSKNMTIILVLMFILFGILVFLNKYFNG